MQMHPVKSLFEANLVLIRGISETIIERAKSFPCQGTPKISKKKIMVCRRIFFSVHSDPSDVNFEDLVFCCSNDLSN